VLFTPDAPGDTMTFQLPIKKAGNYRIAAVITKGPGYGTFSAAVNGTPTRIHFNITRPGNENKTFQLDPQTVSTYDANTSGTSALINAQQGRLVIDRIELDDVMLNAGNNSLTFTLAAPPPVPGTGY